MNAEHDGMHFPRCDHHHYFLNSPRTSLSRWNENYGNKVWTSFSVAGTPSLRLFCDHPRIQSTEWPNLEHCNKVYIRQIRRDIEMCLTDNWTRKCWRNKEDWQTSDRRRGWISSWRTTSLQGRHKIIETHKGKWSVTQSMEIKIHFLTKIKATNISGFSSSSRDIRRTPIKKSPSSENPDIREGIITTI